jgi:hypothetical protein
MNKFTIAGALTLLAGGTFALVTTHSPADTAPAVAWQCVTPRGGWSWAESAEECPSGTVATEYPIPNACDIGYCIECGDCVPDDMTVALLCCEPISGELNCYQIEYMSECANDWILADCYFGVTNEDGSETCFF